MSPGSAATIIAPFGRWRPSDGHASSMDAHAD
jgi:hypothetical protein